MMSLASHVLAQLALPPLPAPPPQQAAARLPKFHVAGALCRRAASRPASFWVYGPPTRRDFSASSCLYAASNWLCSASSPVFGTVTFCAINISGSILRSTIPLLARRRARARQARPRTRLCASKPCSSRSPIPMICQVEWVPCHGVFSPSICSRIEGWIRRSIESYFCGPGHIGSSSKAQPMSASSSAIFLS
jgi:hypothetical protein